MNGALRKKKKKKEVYVCIYMYVGMVYALWIWAWAWVERGAELLGGRMRAATAFLWIFKRKKIKNAIPHCKLSFLNGTIFPSLFSSSAHRKLQFLSQRLSVHIPSDPSTEMSLTKLPYQTSANIHPPVGCSFAISGRAWSPQDWLGLSLLPATPTFAMAIFCSNTRHSVHTIASLWCQQSTLSSISAMATGHAADGGRGGKALKCETYFKHEYENFCHVQRVESCHTTPASHVYCWV